MSRRKCGGCRFFQEAEFAGSGWCHHPLRRTSSDVKIMVRRAELACRNSWDEDLFEPVPAEGNAEPLDPYPVRPESPATPDEIDALITAQSESQEPSESEAKDVVIEIDHIVVGETPVRAEVDNRPTLQTNDPRSAILKAREKYRANSANRRREAELAAPDLSANVNESSAPAEPVDPKSAVVEPTQPPVTGGQGVWAPPPSPPAIVGQAREATDPHDNDPYFDDVPPVVPGLDVPTNASTRARELPVAGLDVDEDDVEPSWDGYGRDGQPRNGRDVPRFSERLSLWTRGRRAPEPRTELATGGAFERLAQRDDLSRRAPANRDPYDTRFVPPPPVPVNEVIAAPGVEPIAEYAPEPEPSYSEPTPIGPEPELIEAIDVVVDDELPISIGPELSPDIPRMCRTCRDFRPADNGERGWCTNRWAFTHRRMVHDDELPCETSLGCWWLPSDETWLAAADISSHGQTTPLVDRWLGDRAPVPRRQPS